jgi:hypothetical protein
MSLVSNSKECLNSCQDRTDDQLLGDYVEQ